MKKLIFILAVMLACWNFTQAANMFHSGMMWECYSTSTAYPFPDEHRAYHTYKLVESDLAADVLTMQRQDKSENAVEETWQNEVYIKTDGNKVFFSLLEKPEDWFLLYDFDIQAEQTITVGYYYTPLSGPDVNTYDLKCLSGFGDSTDSTAELELVPKDSHNFFNTYWLDGIGSTGGPLENVNPNWDGVGYTLVKAWNGDEVYYEYNESSVETFASLREFSAIRAGQGVIVRNIDAGCVVSTFDLSGNQLNRLAVPKGMGQIEIAVDSFPVIVTVGQHSKIVY